MNPTVGIVMLTRNRLPLLKQALPALCRSISVPAEILVVDNGSTDETGDFLKWMKKAHQQTDTSSLKVIRHERNEGTAAYNDAFLRLSAPVLIEVDDDVIEFPFRWERKLIAALLYGERIGYVSTDVIQDEWTDGCRPAGAEFKTRIRKLPDGGSLEVGVIGGWCAATWNHLFREVGGFPFVGTTKFELEDGAFANLLYAKGWNFAIRTDVKVYHASGPKIAKAIGLWSNWYEKYDPEFHPRYAAMRNWGEKVEIGKESLPPRLQRIIA